MKKDYILSPWKKHGYWAYTRCHKKWGTYANIRDNIQYKITPKELKELWFSCNADKMEKPNLHRKSNSLDYTIDNCLFIEEELHRRIHGKR